MELTVPRVLYTQIIKYLKPNKAIVLVGARRVGKTAVVEQLKSNIEEPYLFLNGDDISSHEMLAIRTTSNYERLLGNTKLLIIDEAQEIPDIGAKIKLILDTIKGVKVLLTGSSAIEINNNLGEPLVGRKNTLQMYPLSQVELSKTQSMPQVVNNLEQRLIFGSYPELEHLKDPAEKIEYLKELNNSYLLKDVLSYEGIKKRQTIVSLLKIIAFRIGSEISLESVGRDLQISKNTVERYLNLFEQVFIIYKVSGFNKNLDNEVSKKNKWYFMDNGIRNAIINQFQPMYAREDQGKLWENYLFAERKKYLSHTLNEPEEYFWRTHTKQEIDRIEYRSDGISAFEFKWKKTNKNKIPPLFLKGYPNANYQIIDKENYLDYIAPLDFKW